MQNCIKKTIKYFLAFAFLLSTTSSPIIVPKFPEEFAKIDNAPKLIQLLSVGKKEVWGVDSENKIYRCIIKEKEFKQITPKARLIHVSVGYDDKPWGIGTNNVSYQCNKAKTGWTNKGGKLVQISVGKNAYDHIWGLNKEGRLYYWHKEALFTHWKKHKIYNNNNKIFFKQVSCGYDRSVWALGNDDDSIWRWSKKKWEQIKEVDPAVYTPIIGGPLITLKQIDVGDASHVVGVNNNSVAYMHDDNNKVWRKIGSGIKHISINKDGEIWLITKNGEIYWSSQSAVDQIREAIKKAKKATDEAKKAADEAKKASEKADEEAKKRNTEIANYFAKEGEEAAKKAQEEAIQANKAFQETQTALKTFDIVAAQEAAQRAQTAAKNAQKAAREAIGALFETTMKAKKRIGK